MADANGEKMQEIEDKIKAIFGKDIFKKERGVKGTVDLHTTKLN